MSTGPGRLFGMLQILQKECDRQARKVIEEFKSQRKYDALVGDLTPSFFLLPALVFPKFSWKQVNNHKYPLFTVSSQTKTCEKNVYSNDWCSFITGYQSVRPD